MVDTRLGFDFFGVEKEREASLHRLRQDASAIVERAGVLFNRISPMQHLSVWFCRVVLCILDVRYSCMRFRSICMPLH